MSDDRRTAVLESALSTFARRGFRRTSMDDVAEEARISRPGLYLHFPSKQAVLRAAVEHALERDVGRAERVLADGRVPLPDRLLTALDLWAGQYTGPLATDLEGLLEQDAALLGDVPAAAARRFRDALRRALEPTADADPDPALDVDAITDVVLALTAGTKRAASDREDFVRRMGQGLSLLLR